MSGQGVSSTHESNPDGPFEEIGPHGISYSINIPNAAAFQAEAIDAKSILPSIKKVGKAVLDRLRRRCWWAPRRQRWQRG